MGTVRCPGAVPNFVLFHDIQKGRIKVKKVFSVMVALVLLMTGCCFADGLKTPARIGVLAPIGIDEEGVKRWSENVARVEGKTEAFKNQNTIVLYDNLTSMLMDLQAGRIDRFSISRGTGAYIVAWNKDLQLNDNNHNPILGYSIAMRWGSEKTIQAINDGIKDMREDGTLDKLTRKWIIEMEPGTHAAMSLPVFKDAETIRIAVTGDLPPMDMIRSDGIPSGFNMVFLAELGKRIHKNFQLVSVNADARYVALTGNKVDAVFWARGVFDSDTKPLPYPLDVMDGVVVSTPYFLDSRVSVSKK